jgi:hypothetical protein
MGDTLTPDAQGLALGMAIYPVAYASGAVLLRKARRGSAPVPTGRDVNRAAKSAARKALKRERRRAARRGRR